MALTDLIGPALDAVSGGAFSGALALIQPVGRSIGSIIPDVVIEEGHRDESVVTAQPVEGGAVVTDHIFDLPPMVEIRGGFSNSSAGYVGYVQEQYQELLALKAKKQPFALSTGKRRYKNMVVRALSVVTDPHSEYVLMFTAIIVNINIVQTSTSASEPTTASASPDQASQAEPAATAGISNDGSAESYQIGASSFQGSYSPGAGVAAGSIGDTSIGAVAQGNAIASGALGVGALPDGIAPPPPVSGFDAGEMTFSDPRTGEVVATTPPYDPFAVGAMGVH